MTVTELWERVNSADSLADCDLVEKAIRSAKVDSDTFDELMMAITLQYREINRAQRQSFYK